MYALIDVDDVTLDWTRSFDTWVRLTKSYTGPPIYSIPDRLATLFYPEIYSEFNSSEYFQKLPLVPGARSALNIISNTHKIVFISSCGIEYTKSRQLNLNIMLPDLSYSCITLPLHANKCERIKQFSPKLYIDDNADNCISAESIVGCQSLLYSTPVNLNFSHTNIPRVNSWKEILTHVKK